MSLNAEEVRLSDDAMSRPSVSGIRPHRQAILELHGEDKTVPTGQHPARGELRQRPPGAPASGADAEEAPQESPILRPDVVSALAKTWS